MDYRAVKNDTGYAAATIQLAFGARATGEPNSRSPVDWDIAPVIVGVEFPVASPLVMADEFFVAIFSSIPNTITS